VSERRVVLEESLINSRGQNTPRGGRTCAEKKPREQGIGGQRRRSRTRIEVEESDATKDEATGRKEGERREWGDREVA